ncbi:hypothetical protein NKH77_44745 [Streptomyces sp. M19]
MLVVWVGRPRPLRRPVVGHLLGAQAEDLRDHLAVVGDQGEIAFDASWARTAAFPSVRPQPLARWPVEAEFVDVDRDVRGLRGVGRRAQGTGDHGLEGRVEERRVQAVPLGVDGAGVQLGEDLPVDSRCQIASTARNAGPYSRPLASSRA